MSTITPQDLAREARKLADELERGEGPTLREGVLADAEGCARCAMGHVFVRAGVSGKQLAGVRWPTIGYRIATSMPASWLVETCLMEVAGANDCEPTRVVVDNLRALAAVLESETP